MTQLRHTYGEEKPTYYVIAEGGMAPTRSHPSRMKAHNEASRLARANPGTNFHVVKLKATLRADAVDAQPNRPIDYDRQMEARVHLSIGDSVRIKADHYMWARRSGIIESFGDADAGDTSVFVRLRGMGSAVRFSPTSFVEVGGNKAQESAAAEEAQPSDTPSFGQLFGGLVARTLLDALLGDDKPEPEQTVKAGDMADMIDDIRRVSAFKDGDELYLVMETGLFPLIPASICKAIYRGSAGDPRFALVDLSESGGPPSELANISRLFLRTDPKFAGAVEV